MRVVVTLKEHLTNLESAENRKPPALRRHVPTIGELAKATSLTRQGLYRFADSDAKMVNLSVLSAVISELRRLGFSTELTDILTPYPGDIEASE